MGGTGEEEEENDNGIVTNSIIINIMPCLQSLKIWYCENLKSLPDYLLTAPSLKELKIRVSRLLIERYQRGTGENWHKISHISNIELDRVHVQRDGEPQFDPDIDSETTNQPNVFDDDQPNACTVS
nr:putative disease resistance protein rga3 [Quercus suber]